MLIRVVLIKVVLIRVMLSPELTRHLYSLRVKGNQVLLTFQMIRASF